jgi:hypothetical protein
MAGLVVDIQFAADRARASKECTDRFPLTIIDGQLAAGLIRARNEVTDPSACPVV